MQINKYFTKFRPPNLEVYGGPYDSTWGVCDEYMYLNHFALKKT